MASRKREKADFLKVAGTGQAEFSEDRLAEISNDFGPVDTEFVRRSRVTNAEENPVLLRQLRPRSSGPFLALRVVTERHADDGSSNWGACEMFRRRLS